MYSFLTPDKAKEKINSYAKDKHNFFFMTDFEAQNTLVAKPEDLQTDEIQFVFPSVSHCKKTQTAKPDHIMWNVLPQPFESYLKSFDMVRRNIMAGNSFLTNLTCSSIVKTNISLLQIFEHAHAPYKLWIKDRFTVFSPETFVRIHDGQIYSYPMKGTISLTVPDAAETLLSDRKETAEHATITDLIRNDLSTFAHNVEVCRYRYLDEVRTNKGKLLQMSSEIRGTLPTDYRENLGEILFGMLPAGSISGAPKKKTLEIINKAETYRRGFYTGVMGFFDGENLDSAVMIRFVEHNDQQSFIFKSGGGITFLSDAHNEYDEMINKIYVPIY